MRVITGKARGISLKTPDGMLTRPTADRVKEALFSSFTLANAKFNKNNYHCECNAPDFISNDYIVYNYKQFIPSISLSYKF